MHVKNNLYLIFGLSEIHALKNSFIFLSLFSEIHVYKKN